MTIYMMVGLPASGKSTLAKKLSNGNPDYAYVSRDEIRYKMTGSYRVKLQKEDKVRREFCKEVYSKILEGYSIIFADATHVTPASRMSFYNDLMFFVRQDKKINESDIDIIPLVLDVPWEVCYQRNAQRPAEVCVPDKDMINFYQKKARLPAKDDDGIHDKLFPERLFYDYTNDTFEIVRVLDGSN